MDDSRFDSLIIDPVVETRRRLQQVMKSVIEFRDVTHVTTVEEGTRSLRGGSRVDVVFVSYSFSDTQISDFIELGKSTDGGMDSAYVMILRDKDQDSTRAAKSVLMGADGILFEPYSVDRLVEITRIAARVKKERGEARQKLAINMILDEATNTLDYIATLKSQGVEAGLLMKQFKKACSSIDDLNPEQRQIFFEVLVETFLAAPLPPELSEGFCYRGVSSRVKSKVQEKIIENVEAEKAIKSASNIKKMGR